MKKFLTLALAALAVGATAQEKKDSVVYEVIKENKIVVYENNVTKYVGRECVEASILRRMRRKNIGR